MKNPLRAAMLCLSLIAGSVHAGAWGDGSFDNDDALDWIAESTRARSIAPVSAALGVANSGTFVDAPEGSMAIVAAEVVAAALGHPNPKLPPGLRDWIKRQPSASLTALAPAARSAVRRVANPNVSELAKLWSEGKPNKWPQAMSDLLARLN